MRSTRKRFALLLPLICIPGLRSQTQDAKPFVAAKPPTVASSTNGESRAWFPHNWVRGYMDFAYAPSHNEPDLGRCLWPQPPGSGGAQSLCTAYARYLFTGYVEIQPLNRTVARHLFIYLAPKFTFGDNVPQLKYTQSMTPIAFDREVGVGFKLPRSFELRATQHQVQFLGRYSGYLGPASLPANGPYGQYSTVGARWYFGGYNAAGSN